MKKRLKEAWSDWRATRPNTLVAEAAVAGAALGGWVFGVEPLRVFGLFALVGFFALDLAFFVACVLPITQLELRRYERNRARMLERAAERQGIEHADRVARIHAIRVRLEQARAERAGDERQ